MILASMPRKMKGQSWSMFPSLHGNVKKLLKGSGLGFSFQNADQRNCAQEYDTNIKGRFSCLNSKCAAKGWSSNLIPITIRMYHGQKYNARVYHQRCKHCNWLAKPHLDGSYAERIAYRLKKWSGIQVKQPPYGGGVDGRPHITELCEGCKAGHCKWT
ncbi:unnamed protein product [Clonostachys rhizophaga]|uniref:3CxxC-type domain-containing protein n=1 Tax=Clonostachys rhizophaga TaxID=160324 RepID=A0A9N9VJL5_9HYPO|nr:unnamed protein product [Clonostachys rhizophaga]